MPRRPSERPSEIDRRSAKQGRRRSGRDRDEDDLLHDTPVQRILQQIKKRHDIDDAATRDERKEADMDDRFRNLEQWDPDIKADREARDEPCMVVDMIGTPLSQVVNSHRSSRPGVKFVSRGGGASKEGALYRQGLMRQIEHDSYATAVYAHGFDAAAGGGWGYWRLNIEHVEDHPTDLEIKVDAVLSRFQVRRDPTAKKPTKEDARWWLVIDDMPVSEYKEEYPDSEVASWDELDAGDEDLRDWINEDAIRVVEYWFKRKKKRLIVGLEDGRNLTIDDLPPERKERRKTIRERRLQVGKRYGGAKNPKSNPRITSVRDADLDQVMWCKANGVELLEGNDDLTDAYEWPGKYIPLVEMTGEQLVVKGRIVRRGIVRRMRDPQVMVNVETSDLVTTQARSPKHVWSGHVGQFGTMAPGDPIYDQYVEASSGRRPVVAAVPTKGPNNETLPAPKLESYEPPIQNLIQGISLGTQFIRDTSGWYGAALGDESPDRSGKAIANLVRASEQSSSHFTFNFETALTYTGVIANDLFQYVYDRPGRLVYTMGAKNEEEAILIKQMFRPTPNGPIAVPPGQENLETDKFVDFSVGKYGVAPVPGRNHATMRQEKTEALTAIGSSDPEMMRVVAPDIVESLDFQGADDVADRIDAANPPHLRRKKMGETPIPREAAQQMAQMDEVIKALTAKVDELSLTQQSKLLELQSKEKIAADNNATTMAVEELKIMAKAQADALSVVQQQYDALQARMEAEAGRAQAQQDAILQAILAKPQQEPGQQSAQT